MGVVEEVGALVKRVQKGDRVVVPGTPQCGVCYQCLHGRADWCQFLDTSPAHPIAQMSDGTEIFQQASLGGLSELMVVPEEYCCPVFTDLPAEQLTLLGDTVGTGLAAARDLVQIEPSLERSRARSRPCRHGRHPRRTPSKRRRNHRDRAHQIPPRNRDEGWSHHRPRPQRRRRRPSSQDPFALQRNHRPPLRRRPIRSNHPTGFRSRPRREPTSSSNAVGNDWFPPKSEVGPDPTAILPLEQTFDMTRAGGHIVMLGVAWRGDVKFNAAQFSNRGRSYYSGQQGGLNMLRDIPRYVKLIEKRQDRHESR